MDSSPKSDVSFNIQSTMETPTSQCGKMGIFAAKELEPPNNCVVPLHEEVASFYRERLKSASDSSKQVNSRSPKKCVYLDPSIIYSIGQYYSIIASSQADSSLPILSQQGASVITTTIEFRLRSLIQTVSQFARNSIGSRSQNNIVRFCNVFDALQFYRIKMDKIPGVFLTFGAPLGSTKYANTPSCNLSPAATYYPPNIFLSHWNLSPSLPDSSNSLNIVSTEDFVHEDSTESPPSKLPIVTIQWLAVDGCIVDSSQRNLHFFDDNNICVPPSSYNICSPIYNLKGRGVDFLSSLASLNIVSQTERVHHDLTREHYLLLNKLREIFRKPFYDPATEFAHYTLQGLHSVETSPGVRQLVPYLLHFACQQIYTPLASPSLFSGCAAGLRTMLRVFIALVRNSSLQLQHYIHQVIQAIQTLVLHPLLVCKGFTVQASIALRRGAAKTLAFICEHFAFLHGPGIGGFVGKMVASVYQKALSADQPIPTLLGAVIGLRCLGPRALQIVLLPRLPALCGLLSLTSCPHYSSASVLPHSVHEFRVVFVIELLSAISDSLSEVLHTNPVDGHDFLSLILPIYPGVLESVKEPLDIIVESLGDTLTPFFADAVVRKSSNLDTSQNELTRGSDEATSIDAFSLMI